MTVIRGSADLLRRGGLSDARRRRYLDAIIDTADRAARLTSHLLAFGRRQAIKPEIVDLNVRLDAFAEVVSRTIGTQIGVTLELSPDLWPTEVDLAQLETALLNAAINARDAMPEGGQLTISTANVPDEAGDMVRVSLADDGEGMSEEVLSRVFEPFFTTKPVGKGTGLGLSQIHGFAAQAGGRAEIHSTPGTGTTVSLYLPRAHASAQPSSLEERTVADGAGRTVLLVEDNEQVREFAENLLADLQYRVVAASSADEAIDLLDKTQIDLLFSDIVMPGRSGIELAETVRRKYPHLPIVLATGYSEELTNGAAPHFQLLSKPYGAQSLGSALSGAFEEAGQVTSSEEAS
jgi:CheY-like chemotaxis protein